jgi:hypothetical protein
MAGVVAGAGAGFHRMSLKPQRRLSVTKRDLRSQRSSPLASAGAAPFGLVIGPTPIAAACHGAFGSTSTGEKKLGLAKAWKIEDSVKG